jgi:mono/diheme cytochrome c family protein
LLDTITNGKSGGMPAFGDDLTPEQISRLLRCVVRGFGKFTGNR